VARGGGAGLAADGVSVPGGELGVGLGATGDGEAVLVAEPDVAAEGGAVSSPPQAASNQRAAANRLKTSRKRCVVIVMNRVDYSRGPPSVTLSPPADRQAKRRVSANQILRPPPADSE
jgi:hypothetical protein